jgi:cobalt-zinc-cadmium efflux system membrane fusion protein
MKSHKFLLLLIVLGFSFQFCSSTYAENTIQLSEEHLNSLGITLGKFEDAKQLPVLNAPAKVVIPAAYEFLMSASQAGLITKLNAAVGDNVKKGQVLAQLNSPSLLSMQRLYLKALTDLQLNLFSYQRDKKLWDEGVIAERRWQETSSQYNAFVYEANELKQLLEISGMTAIEIDHLSKTHQLSSQLSMHAPISGVVIERLGVVGERVDILAPIYRVANLDELWLEIDVPHERLGRITVGDQVLIDNTPIRAEIKLVGQSVNPENQTVQVRAKIIGKQSTVRSGQTINTQIIERIETQAFKVPNTAIAQHEGNAFIFVRNQDGFKVSPITVIGQQTDESIVKGDFVGNEAIAIKGAVALKAQWLGLGSPE